VGGKILNVRVAGLTSLPASARKARLLEAVVRAAFKSAAPRARGEVAVVFLSREKMRAMNREYLGHDYDTDVISFSHDPVAGVPVAERPLGDVYVSSWMAARQARELGHPVLREALTLAAHGTLHLIGHDDATARGRARMFRLQDELVARALA
jgi:probable rRNA maturation factor